MRIPLKVFHTAMLCSVFSFATQHGGAIAQERSLDEVVVTAQKREQSAQDVPISLSAYSADALDKAGVDTIQDLSRISPSLEAQTNTSPVEGNFRIRRVGNLGNIPTFEPAVGLFIDGAFRVRSIFGVSELFDIERIEVLRGPQSTLYGKNTTAGVIGIFTSAPGDELSGGAEASVGMVQGARDAASVNLKGGIRGPLSESVGFGISAAYAYQDEIVTSAVPGGQDANGINRVSVRGQLTWQATPDLDFRLIGGLVREDDRQDTEDIFFDNAGFVGGIILPSLQGTGIGETCADNDPHNRVTCLRRAVTTELDAYEATLLANYSFANGWSLSSVTSYDYYQYLGAQDDVAQVIAPVLQFHDTQDNTAFQQELRLNSAGGEKIDWLLGAYYYTNTFTRGDDNKRPIFLGDTQSNNAALAGLNQALLMLPIPLPFATPGQLGFIDAEQETDYIGVYGQATITLSDRLSLTGGLRWQNEEKSASIFQSVNDPSPSVISLLLSPAAVSIDGLNRDTSDLTWSVSPQFFVNDNTMVYFTASHGFKSGGFNVGFGQLPVNSREFQDEDIMHYEGGVKADLWNNRIRLAASGFYTAYKNYQDAAFVGAQFTVGNAEKAELKGGELEGTVLLSDTLTADFAVSYADFAYKRNTSGQCFPGRASDSPTTPGACVLDSENPVNAPKWKSHIGVTYERPTQWGDAFARIDWSWTDEYNTSFSADPMLKQEAYSWLNLRTGMRWGNYEFTLWAENLLDKTVVNFDAVVNIYAGDNSYQSYLQQPRSFGAKVRASF